MAEEKILFRVQSGAFTEKQNAINRYNALKALGFPVYMVKKGKYFKIQVGAYEIKSNAINMRTRVREAGFNAFITTEKGEPVSMEPETPAKDPKVQFIEAIAAAVNKFKDEFNIKVASPIIAQACLESAYGTTNKAKYNNFFGLKYRPSRCPSASGTFSDGSSEQRADGTYYQITDDWFKFDTLELGVRGYFEYTSISRYDNIRGVTDPLTYLQNIRADGYATSLKYVENVYRVIETWNLTKYDV